MRDMWNQAQSIKHNIKCTEEDRDRAAAACAALDARLDTRRRAQHEEQHLNKIRQLAEEDYDRGARTAIERYIRSSEEERQEIKKNLLIGTKKYDAALYTYIQDPEEMRRGYVDPEFSPYNAEKNFYADKAVDDAIRKKRNTYYDNKAIAAFEKKATEDAKKKSN